MNPSRRGRPKLDEWNSATPAQAARFLGVTPQTVYSRMYRGELPHERVGKHTRIPLAALKAMREREARRR